MYNGKESQQKQEQAAATTTKHRYTDRLILGHRKMVLIKIELCVKKYVDPNRRFSIRD